MDPMGIFPQDPCGSQEMERAGKAVSSTPDRPIKKRYTAEAVSIDSDQTEASSIDSDHTSAQRQRLSAEKMVEIVLFEAKPRNNEKDNSKGCALF